MQGRDGKQDHLASTRLLGTKLAPPPTNKHESTVHQEVPLKGLEMCYVLFDHLRLTY